MEAKMEGCTSSNPNSPCLGRFLVLVLLKGEVVGSDLGGAAEIGNTGVDGEGWGDGEGCEEEEDEDWEPCGVWIGGVTGEYGT